MLHHCFRSLFAFVCFTISVGGSLVFLSCGSSRKAAEHRVMDTITVSARNNPLEIYRATTPRVWEIVHTALTLEFDFAKKEAAGAELISVMPYAYAPDTLVLDAKGMEIKSVELKDFSGDKFSPLAYSYDGLQLKVNVRGLYFGDLVIKRQQTFRILYTAKPYATKIGGSAAITEDRGLYFINTDKAIPGKPVQIWTQGETESNSHWMATIDKPNQRSTFDISLTVPDSLTTLSNGRLVSMVPAGAGMRRDEWQMTQPIQVYAAMFAIGRFDITKDDWRDAQGLSHEVSYYTEPAYAPFAREMFRYTPEMLTCFSKATGVSFPWYKYSQVVVRDYVSGAMENTTASLFGEFTNKNARQLIDESNEDVVSHELFHQWFGDYVTAESWSNLTLNESFATYGEQIWRACKYGQASADELANSDLQRYLESTRYKDPPLVRHYYRDREEMFDRVSYQKGACILRYIHSIVGDTLFTRAMDVYLRRNALESAEAANWRMALEYVTGKDWTSFFNEWYLRGGHPVLIVHYAVDNAAHKLNVTVRQRNAPDSSIRYNLSLKTAVIYSTANMRVEEWNIKDAVHTFSYDMDAGGKYPLIIPDVAHVLPGVIKEDKSLEDWMRQLDSSRDYVSKQLAIDAAFNSESKPLTPTLLQHALNDTLRGIRLYTMRRLSGIQRQPIRDVLLQQVKYILQNDGNTKVRGAALSVLGSWNDKSELPALVQAVGDSSYLVAGSALSALTSINPDTAYVLAHEVLRHNPKSSLEAAAWNAIVSKGNAADLALFSEDARHVYGGEKVALAGNISRYAAAVKDDTIYKRCLDLLVDMAKSESIRGYRFAIGADVFGLRDIFKEKKDTNRRNLAEQYTQAIVAAETDPDNISKYKEIGQAHSGDGG
jgi:aminopeptidase N